MAYINDYDKSTFNNVVSTPIRQSRKNLISESPALPEKNTFNNYITHSYDKEKRSANEEWDQTETEWDAEQGEKDSEEWGKSKQKRPWAVEEQEDEILKDPWEEQVDKWCKEELILTEKQRKLNEELLDILKSINCYAEVYNFYTDLDYDRPGTANLEKFLEDHKDEQDLKVVLDLKRGESETTILLNVANFNIAAVCLLLEAGADHNIKDKGGKTPLHYAIEDNCTQAVIMLLEKGSDVNAQDNKGKTPLHYAVDTDSEYEDLVAILVGKGAKVDIQDNEGNTPLHISARCCYGNVTEHLMEKNPNVDLQNKKRDTPLHLALRGKDESVTEAILTKSIKIDLSVRDSMGDTPLLLAASLAHAGILKEILKQGADIKCTNGKGNTALHYAACNEYTGENCKTKKYDFLTPDNDALDINSNDYSEDTAIKSVNELIAKGMDVNIKNMNGNTPLFFAIEYLKPEVVKQLVENGASADVRDKNGLTVFDYAVKMKSLKMLSIILPHKINEFGAETEEVDTEKAKEILPKIIDNKGNTLLHWAARYGCSRKMLNFLVENGVDVNAKNKNGVAPIHIAAKYGHEHLMNFFIESKAELNAKCGNFAESEVNVTENNFVNMQDGSTDASSVINVKNDTEYKKVTPMSIAANNSHENTVGQLLSQGAKVNISDNRGWTPIYIAIRTACDKNCKEEEREKAYKIIEKLAVFSNIGVFKSKNQITTKIKELLTGRTEESFLVQAINNNERIRKILENAIRNRESDKLPNAPVDQYAPSAPPLDDNFYDKIGSYVKGIPDLKLYPDLSGEFKELEKNTVNMDISIDGITLPKDTSVNSTRLENLDDVSKKVNNDTSKNQSKSKTDLGKECSNKNPTRDIVKHPEQKIESESKIRLTSHDRERLNQISDKVVKTKDIVELNQVVNEALKSGIRLNFSQDNKNTFVNAVISKAESLNGIKEEDDRIAGNIICQLILKGGRISDESYGLWTLEKVFSDYREDMEKAKQEFDRHFNKFKGIAESAISQGKLKNLEIDNTTFSLEYSKDSIVDVAKVIDGAKSLGLNQGNMSFGGNIVKIGESAVEIEINNGIRNYTNLSDNGDVILTFQTSLGELEVRLIEDKDRITVEVSDNDRKILDQLKDKKEIGKNCLLGGYSVYDAIEQGYFERPGKLQSFETVSFISQGVKGKVEEIMESISRTSIKGIKEEKSWQSRVKAEKTNGSCGRGM